MGNLWYVKIDPSQNQDPSTSLERKEEEKKQKKKSKKKAIECTFYILNPLL